MTVNNIQKAFKMKSKLRRQGPGEVNGKGGPTEDKVGPVLLSDGEYVLPADTVEAVGREQLDALLEATHKPVRGKLRGMANGGPFYVDPEGRVAPHLPSREVVPYNQPQAPAVPSRAGPPAIPTPADQVAGVVDDAAPPPRTGTASPTQPAQSGLRRTLRGLSPAMRVLGAMGGAYQLAEGARSAYERGLDSRNAMDIGAGGTLALNALTRVNPVVNAMATGVAVGRGIDSALAQDVRDRIGGVINQGVRNVGRMVGQDWGVDDSALLEQDAAARIGPQRERIGHFERDGLNVPLFRQGDEISAGEPRPGQPSERTMGALRGILERQRARLGTGPQVQGGGGGPMFVPNRNATGRSDFNMQSRIDAINERFDAMQKRLEQTARDPRSQGNLRRHLVNLQIARENAINNVIGVATNAQTDMARIGADTLRARANAVAKAQEDAAKQSEKGYERYTEAVGRMFVDPETGEPNLAEQENFLSFVEASDPTFLEERFANLSPADQMRELQRFRMDYEINKRMNERSGLRTNVMDRPVGLREATFDDLVNGTLGFSDYLYSNIPFFTNPNVVETETGRVALYDDLTDGGDDLDAAERIRQSINESRLRRGR